MRGLRAFMRDNGLSLVFGGLTFFTIIGLTHH